MDADEPVKHVCISAKAHKFQVERITGDAPWQVYDRMSHVYIIGIEYCPFCGSRLVNETELDSGDL